MARQSNSATVFRPHRIKCVDSALLPTAAIPVNDSSNKAILNLSHHFSQSHMALALVIQKSKPDGMSTKDYCDSLKKSIRDTQSLPNNVRRLVDSGEFWKEQCEKALREKKALERHIMVLEDHGAGEDRSVANVSWGKRLPEGSLSRMNLADARVQPTLPQRDDDDDKDQDRAEANAFSLSSYLIRLGTQRKILESLCGNPSQSTWIEHIVKTSTKIFDILRTIICDSCFTLCLLKTNDEDRRCLAIIQQLLSQMDLSYRSCFDALKELSRTIVGRQKCPILIYHLATFFDHVLKHLHDTSTIQIQYENEDPEYHQTHNGKRQRIQVRGADEYAINNYLMRMLVSIVKNNTWDKGHQSQEVFEGIMFSVLNHTGRLLSLAIFEEHVAASKAPGNISTRSADDSDFSKDVKCESRYLIEILRAVMTVHNRLSKKQDPALLQQAEKRIQATLINGTIGGLEDTLKLPSVPEQVLGIAENSTIEEYGSEWLLARVWALVGWEMI